MSPRLWILFGLIGVAYPIGEAGSFYPDTGRQLASAESTGYLVGQVVDSERSPIGSAVVTLRLDGSAAQTRVLTNQDGRFAFQRIASGTYRVEASRAGYSGGSYGRFAPDMPARVLVVAAAQSHTDITVTLFKNAVIAGRVLGDGGLPLADVPVRLVYPRPHPRVPGATVLMVWPSTMTTDDRGVYRFTAPPGRYTVMVAAPTAPDGTRPVTGHLPLITGDGNVRRTYAPTFHPSTSSITEAQLHDVQAGQVKDNVDVQLVPAGATHVTGRAVSPSPWPTGTIVRLLSDYGDAMTIEDPREVGRATLNTSGTFTFSGVPSGAYRLRIVAPPAGRALWLDHAVTVDGANTTFDATVDTGTKVSGRALFIGDKQPSAAELARTTISFLPLGGPSLAPVAVRLNTELGFDAGPYPSGRYFAEATPPPGWSLREVRMGDVDVSRVPVELPPGPVEGVTAVFVNTVSSLAGRVESPSDWMRTLVVVFPEAHATEPAGIFRGRRRQAVTVEADGTFKFQDLPPGDYFVVATGAEGGAEWQMPASLKQLSAQATRVRVVEGQAQSVTIPGRRLR